MKTKTILILIMSLFTTMAFADSVPAANCVMGQGCKFYMTSSTAVETAITLGVDEIPKGAILVTATVDGKMRHYLETKKTRWQLDLFYGGDGNGYRSYYPLRIQPKSGLWSADFGQVTETGCEFINQFQQENHVVNMLQGLSAQREFHFNDPFDPWVLMPSDQIEWMTGANLYIGFLGNNYMNMMYVVQIKTPTLIEGYYEINTIVPVEGGKCEYHIPYTMKCIKPDPEKDKWDNWEEQEKSNPSESDNNGESDWDIPLLGDDPDMPEIPLLDIDKVLPEIPLFED